MTTNMRMERITDSEAVMAEIIYPELSYAVQGAFYDVYNALRHLDLSEHGWESALEIALVERGIVVERQVEFELRYKGYRIGRFFVDVVADGKLVIELKVEEALLTSALRALLYEIHRELGPGFMHMHYRRAVQIELRLRGIAYEVKKEITILFRERPIEKRETRLIIVDDKLVLAPVAVREITPALKGRFHQYVRLSGLRLGLIANFHAPRLEIATVRV